MALKLVKPREQHKQKILAYRDAFLETSTVIPGSASLHELPIVEWYERVQLDLANPRWGRVPASQYMSIDSETEDIIGMIQLRHELNEDLENYGGHIGYSVHPSHRKQGHATTMVKLCLDKAKRIGIPRVLIVCDVNNEASARVIEKSGGIFEDIRTDPSDGTSQRRYWITLEDH